MDVEPAALGGGSGGLQTLLLTAFWLIVASRAAIATNHTSIVGVHSFVTV
jgi:hypothetical protein